MARKRDRNSSTFVLPTDTRCWQTVLGEGNVGIGSAMTDEEDWLKAGAALIAKKSNPRPLADLLRSRKEIPEAAIHLLATLLDPPSTDPLGMRLKVVETQNPAAKPPAASSPAANAPEVPAQEAKPGHSNAIGNKDVEHEPWHGTTIRSAVVFYETTILLTKRYTKHLMKWVNHDI
jgi:hypothetical protein